MLSPCCLCVCDFLEMKLHTYINGSWVHLNYALYKSLQLICVSICICPVVAKQRLSKNPYVVVNATARQKRYWGNEYTRSNCCTRRILCRPCHIKESRRIVLPRTSCMPSWLCGRRCHMKFSLVPSRIRANPTHCVVWQEFMPPWLMAWIFSVTGNRICTLVLMYL
jgi:hypothetical protein